MIHTAQPTLNTAFGSQKGQQPLLEHLSYLPVAENPLGRWIPGSSLHTSSSGTWEFVRNAHSQALHQSYKSETL